MFFFLLLFNLKVKLFITLFEYYNFNGSVVFIKYRELQTTYLRGAISKSIFIVFSRYMDRIYPSYDLMQLQMQDNEFYITKIPVKSYASSRESLNFYIDFLATRQDMPEP